MSLRVHSFKNAIWNKVILQRLSLYCYAFWLALAFLLLQEAQEPEANELSPCEGLQNHIVKRQRSSARKLECQRLHKKFSKLLNAVNVNGQVHQSLAVSNAIELFKLIFLSTSTEPEVSNLLAEILRRYSEHDLFAAFNYLREKRIMVNSFSGLAYFMLVLVCTFFIFQYVLSLNQLKHAFNTLCSLISVRTFVLMIIYSI